MGAVPVQDAKWLRSGNRVMSATSTSSRCGTGRPDAVQVQQRGAGGSDQFAELLVGSLLA